MGSNQEPIFIFLKIVEWYIYFQRYIKSAQ